MNAAFIASNAYGNSALSGVGGGAIVVLVPDAPLTLAEDRIFTNKN